MTRQTESTKASNKQFIKLALNSILEAISSFIIQKLEMDRRVGKKRVLYSQPRYPTLTSKIFFSTQKVCTIYA